METKLYIYSIKREVKKKKITAVIANTWDKEDL